MELVNNLTSDVAIKLALRAGSSLAGLAALAMLAVLLLHTLQTLGNRSFLYRKRQPVAGWSKRFYPACAVLIISLLVIMWLLNVWSHTVLRSSFDT